MKVQYLILIIAAIYFYDMSNGHKILNFIKNTRNIVVFYFIYFYCFAYI